MHIFKTILLLSCTGSIIFLILMALKPVTKKTFGSKWQYYVWLALLIVMMLPITIKLPKKIEVAPIEPASVQTQTNNFEYITEQTPINPSDVSYEQNIPMNNVTDMIHKATFHVGDIAMYVWLIGAVLFFAFKTISYMIFLFTVHKNSNKVTCDALTETLKEKNMKNNIRVRNTDYLNTPLMVGLFRPTLLLPSVRLSETEFNYVLCHELTHIKRHDIWYKWLALIVNSIHWFNPFVYMLIKQINEECEISCDLEVTKSMDTQNKNNYMNTILNLLSANKTQMLTTSMACGKKQINRRFTMIQNYKKQNKFSSVISIIAASVLFMSTLFINGVLANELSDNGKIEVYNNDQLLNFANKPFETNKEIYVPLREVMEACGATVNWDSETKMIEITYPNKDISMKLTSHDYHIYIDDEYLTLVHPTTSIDGVTYIPHGVLLRIKYYSAEQNTGRSYDFLNNLRILSYNKNGEFDAIIEPTIQYDNNNKRNPETFYEQGERVFIGTLSEQESYGYFTPTSNERNDKLIKRIVVNASGEVMVVIPVEAQFHEMINSIFRSESLYVTTIWHDNFFSGGIVGIDNEPLPTNRAFQNPETDEMVMCIPIAYQIQEN